MNIYIFTKLRSILNKLLIIRSSTGLNENFDYTPDQTSAFLKTAHSLKNADTVLDSVLSQATNEINVAGIRINGEAIIDVHGRWVKDRSELVGPQGIQGIQGISGTNGINGLNGNMGLQGTSGSNGVQGITGSQGTNGTQGLSGNSVAVKGTVSNPSSLPSSGATIGDIYIISQSGSGFTMGDGYVYSSGNSWVNIGQFRGVQGLQGITGAGTQGTSGAQGLQGILGLQGSIGHGAQGTQGITGLQGLLGLQGNQGAVGNVSYEVFVSATEPTAANGKNGDIWLTYHSF